MTSFLNDLRHTLRRLVRAPGFTAVAVLTLALGIGATAAVFTLVDGVLLRPLPFDEPEELLSIQHLGRGGQDELPMSSGLYLLYGERAATLESVGMHQSTAGNLVVEGEPERVPGQQVTPDYFRVLGASAARGRTFVPEEGRPGGAQVVVLSDGLWRSHFGADPSILGRTVDLSGVAREVVGIMPADFGFPDRTARFWIPLVIDPTQAPLAAFFANGIARVAPGSSQAAVEAEIAGMLGDLETIFPEDGGASFLMDVGLRARIEPLKTALVGDVDSTLWILLGTVAFVLLIACANVANLLLVRAEGRHRELSVRVALGAGRWEIVRSFVSESVVLATLGGAAGLGLAVLAVRLTARFIPADLPRMAEVAVDGRILGFTATVALGSALLAGLVPLLRLDTRDLAGALKEGGGARGASGGAERHRLRNGLVVAQVALALVLLVGSGLMFRSFLALRAADPGFDPGGALTARVIVPQAEIEDPVQTAELFRTLRSRLEEVPGVRAVGMVGAVPMGGGGLSFGGMEVEDHPRGPDELPVFASLAVAGAGAVEALGIDVIEGRGPRAGDGGDEGRNVVVSRSFARAWWPESSALGRRVRYGAPDEGWYTIVGVVEDVHQNGLSEPATEAVYFPPLGEADGTFFATRALDVVVRTEGDPLDFVPILRRELRALNPRIPLANPRSLETIVRESTARTSFTMTLLGSASGIALLLGLVGIYGVISYVVAQRTREIGVRMALGASRGTVQGMVLKQALLLAVGGVVLGLAGAAALSRVMEAVLYGVGALDAVTYATVAGSLLAVAVLAAWIPALRAARVEPSRALRTE